MKSTYSFSPIAWTGGSSPSMPSNMGQIVTAYRRSLFRQQVNTFRAYWGDCPNMDTMRIFFRRACGDAHATFRNASN